MPAVEPVAAPAAAQRSSRGRVGGTLASLAVSGALLAALYRTIDIRLVGEALLRADLFWLVVSVGVIVPITFLRAARFFWVAPAGALPGIGEAFRLTLVTSALNVFLPAKSGDLSKSYFVARRSDTTPGVAIAIVVYERVCDLFALITWCVLAWVVARPQTTALPPAFWGLLAFVAAASGVLIASERAAIVARAIAARLLRHRKLERCRRLVDGWPDLLRILRGRRAWIAAFSLLLWLVHLLQLWLFTVALAADVPFAVCASLSSVALMAGQLPLTIGGLGTRDVALVVLLSPYMAPESAAAMGLLMATRTLVPPLMGLPIMRRYLSSIVGDVQRWRAGEEQTG